MEKYDRYKYFKTDGVVQAIVPFVKIENNTSDLNIIWDKNTMRLDSISYKYYGDANFAWLILQANPSVGGYEYLIKSGTYIRIPYPLDSAISRYEKECIAIKK